MDNRRRGMDRMGRIFRGLLIVVLAAAALG